MDIRQLMAGNLVTTNGKPSGTTNGNIYKILDTNSANRLDELKLIGGATIEILDGEYRTTVGAWLDYLEPIEITDDLLGNIGLSKDYHRYNTKIGKYEIYIVHHYDFNERFNLVIYDNEDEILLEAQVVYLHTLQNLIFDVTDLELNVENLITKKHNYGS